MLANVHFEGSRSYSAASIPDMPKKELEERVAELREAFAQLSTEAMRLKKNLERAHQVQILLVAISQQWLEEADKKSV